jgi:hypothetical protein
LRWTNNQKEQVCTHSLQIYDVNPLAGTAACVTFVDNSMNPSVLSLRCPNCGRPFLSLPQQPRAFLTCPHCAQSSLVSSFEIAGTPSAGNAVPFLRRVIQNQPTPPPPQFQQPPQDQTIPPWLKPTPSYDGEPQSQPASSWNSPQHAWAPQKIGNPMPKQASWPPAPEQIPIFVPPNGIPYSPAPAAESAWRNPSMASPFSLAKLDAASTQSLPPLKRSEGHQNSFELPPSATFTEVTMTPWQQPKKRSAFPLSTAFLAIVLTACLWVLKDDGLPLIMPDLTATNPDSSTTPAASPIPVQTPVQEKAQAEPEPEVRRAEVIAPPMDLMAAQEAAEKLFTALMEAKKPEERLALIASQEEHATDVAEFFNVGKLDLLSFKPSNATLHHLPSQEIAPMFEIVTKQCTHGALMRVVQKPGGGFLLDWPLFAESHAQKLVQFIESKSTQPVWHHVCLRRNHGLELPEEEREHQVSLTLQSSLDTSGKCAAVALKGSSIGRYLSRETKWGTLYVARLLLQHRALKNGTLVITVLDCEGAAAGSTQ